METVIHPHTTTVLLVLAIEAARRAGEAIMAVYDNEDFNVEFKPDDSPLTKADTAANEIIKQTLLPSGLPILSEEGRQVPYSERKNWSNYWLVDPLDGTKEFIKRNGEFTVNIALMKENRPVAGVVFAPSLDTLYYGSIENGASKIINGIEEPLLAANDTDLNQLMGKEKVVIVASRSHSNPETENFIAQYKTHELCSMGSSLKFMLLADGKADIYPRIAPTMEWDTAAAHAILNALNRKVFQYNTREELIYNKENLLNPYFVAL
jgi:3'(2'), 5'-bisphosphate nucleotidase